MLEGAVPIGRTSLALAAFEGRDYIAELRTKRAVLARVRLDAAQEAERAGFKVRRIKEYAADVLRFDTAGM